MADITSFIEQARAKGLADDQIRQALVSKGWDEAHINVALIGLEVPDAGASETASAITHNKRPSLSPLLAALHHVLLWFFTGSSTVTIAGVVISLSGENVSSQVLASMIAVTVITFIPYAVLFISFLRQARRTPGLVPGKVWSIITICLHAIGAMIAAITFVVALITSGEQSLIISALLISALDLIVVTTYCFAAFATERAERARRIVTLSYLPLLGILFGVLFVLSLLQLGPARHDETLRKDLTATVQKISVYATEHRSLPEDASNLKTNLAIEYSRESSSTYEVCADFQTSNRSSDYDRSSQPMDDGYVYDSQFYTASSGRNCFTFTSAALQTSEIDILQDLDPLTQY